MYLFTVTMFPNEQYKKDGYEEFEGEQDWYFGALSKMGLEICQAFEKATGKPFYYYLFRYYARYYSTKKQNCPICGSEWKLAEDNTAFINYQCDKCRLVADIVNRNC